MPNPKTKYASSVYTIQFREKLWRFHYPTSDVNTFNMYRAIIGTEM